MICCKLVDFVAALDKRTRIEFVVSSMEKFAHFEGDVFDFLKSYLYQVYSTDFVCEIKITGNSTTNRVLKIVVTTATE